MYEKSRHLMSCHIAGFTYYDGLDVIDELVLGTPLTLTAEPENPYDPNAIVVHYKDIKIGYVPREKTSILGDLLYFGHSEILTAKINHRNLEADPEHHFRIVVKIKDNR